MHTARQTTLPYGIIYMYIQRLVKQVALKDKIFDYRYGRSLPSPVADFGPTGGTEGTWETGPMLDAYKGGGD